MGHEFWNATRLSLRLDSIPQNLKNTAENLLNLQGIKQVFYSIKNSDNSSCYYYSLMVDEHVGVVNSSDDDNQKQSTKKGLQTKAADEFTSIETRQACTCIYWKNVYHIQKWTFTCPCVWTHHLSTHMQQWVHNISKNWSVCPFQKKNIIASRCAASKTWMELPWPKPQLRQPGPKGSIWIRATEGLAIEPMVGPTWLDDSGLLRIATNAHSFRFRCDGLWTSCWNNSRIRKLRTLRIV